MKKKPNKKGCGEMAEIPSAEQSMSALVEAVHGIASSHLPVEIGIGLVIAPLPNIKVAWNNIILEKNQLYINAALLKGYERQAKGRINIPKATGSVKIDSASGNIKANSTPRMGGHHWSIYYFHGHKIASSYKASLKGNYKADITGDYTANIIYTDYGLEVGDLVSLLPTKGGQMFIIQDKIYYLGDG